MSCLMLCLVQPSEGWGSCTAPDRSRCKVQFLQLQDGGDWPWAGRAGAQEPFLASTKHWWGRIVLPGWAGNRAASLLLLMAQLQSRTSRKLHLLCCQPLQQGPSVTGHHMPSPRHPQKQMPWQWLASFLCHIPFSCSSLWFLSCSSEMAF